MNRLLFMLITVTGIVSLYGMDVGSYYYMKPPQPRSPWQSTHGYGMMSHQSKTRTDKHSTSSAVKLSSIIFTQIYHKLSEFLPREIAQYIVLLQLKASNIDLAQFPLEIKQSGKDPKILAQCIDRLIESCGYNLATELFKQFFPHERSICDIKNRDGNTALHYAAREGYTEMAKILLDTAGDNAWTLLAMKDDSGETALHKAVYSGSMEVVKLLLDTACNNTWTLLTMKNTIGWTALHFAAHYDLTEIVTLFLYAAGDKVQDYTAMETNQGETVFYLTCRARLKSFSANLKKINDNVACLIS